MFQSPIVSLRRVAFAIALINVTIGMFGEFIAAETDLSLWLLPVATMLLSGSYIITRGSVLIPTIVIMTAAGLIVALLRVIIPSVSSLMWVLVIVVGYLYFMRRVIKSMFGD